MATPVASTGAVASPTGQNAASNNAADAAALEKKIIGQMFQQIVADFLQELGEDEGTE